MNSQSIALFDFTNGSIMIGVFVLVCIGLVIVIMSMINGGKNKDNK